MARLKRSLIFPAKFSLVAAMNPCPCGYLGDSEKECKCSAYEVIKYQRKVSGPLLDRIDIQIRVPRVMIAELRSKNGGARTSPFIKKRIEGARFVQKERFGALPAAGRISINAEMSSKQSEELIKPEPQAERFLETLDRSRLSPRGYYRLLKVARTIADLDSRERVSAEHLAEAFSYRLREEV